MAVGVAPGRLRYGSSATGGASRGLRSPPAARGGGFVCGLFRLRPM